MKYLFAMSLVLSFFYSRSQGYTAVRNISEDIIRIKPSANQKADSTTLYFDDKGTALSYRQFSELLTSGKYVAKYSADSISPKRVSLKKLSNEESQQFNTFIRDNTKINNEVISEGKKLNTDPFKAYINAAKLNNKVIVQLYWYEGCRSCNEALTNLAAFAKEIGTPKNLTFLVITTDDKYLAAKKVKESQLENVEVIGSAKTLAEAYQINEFPAYIVSDKNQVIRYAVAGSSRLTIPDLKEAIRAAVAE